MDQNEHVLRLEDELRLTRGRLQATIEELESANEELKSSNEEYQSLNEELQSANEELETSKEELQSVNEELTTVNGELAHRVQELGRSNSDLKNFLEATRIATLFLDNDLRVTNFTPAITDLFHLVPSDEGRPIGHIMPRLAYDDLQADTRRVLRTLAPVEREVGDPATGARYMVRVLPYRSTDNVIAGVVVTFVDVTARRRAEEALRESEERFRAIVETARDYAIFTIDAAGRIETWPKGAQEIFGWTAGEALGQPVEMTFTPEDRAKGVPEKERLQAREKGHATDVRWHLRKDGSRVFIDGIVRPLHGPDSQLRGFVKVGQDVTERRATEEALRESEARFRQFGDASADVLWIRDCESLAFEYVSPALEEVYGVKLEHILDGHHVRRWAEMIVPEDRDKALDALRRVREGEHVLHSFRILRADGEVRWIRATDFPLLDEEGHVQRIGGIAHDATEEVELQDRLKVLVAELQHRSRNLVAVVRGVADRTLATSGTLEDFRTRFRPRLDALSRVNSLLSRLEEGDRITFDQLLQAELTAHGVLGFDGQGEQVALQGPDGIRLRSATVQTFALAIHELATNALKHGALSRPEGRLEVGWSLIPARPSVSGKPGERWLKVDWRETGVPPDLPDGRPKDPGASLPRQGYGRELIERALPYQLKAQTSYELTPEGVRCTIVMPVSSALDVAFSSH